MIMWNEIDCQALQRGMPYTFLRDDFIYLFLIFCAIS